ncbi:MAG: hypothetical protein GY928_05260 [Colwellia sp.]|nr:hypothetical protein [Colwellia sp.]
MSPAKIHIYKFSIFFFIASLFCTYSHQTVAAAHITYLNIYDDIVEFSIAESKSHTAPSCALAESRDKFAASLKTESGHTIYSLLMMAAASKQTVGIERAKIWGISAQVQKNPRIGKPLCLNLSDVTTKGGRIVDSMFESEIFSSSKVYSTEIKVYIKPDIQAKNIYSNLGNRIDIDSAFVNYSNKMATNKYYQPNTIKIGSTSNGSMSS